MTDQMTAERRTGWEMAAKTDIGLIRTRNEDSIRIIPERGIAILSDGMGGHRAGDVASNIAVEVIASSLAPSLVGEDQHLRLSAGRLVYSLQLANAAILKAADEERDFAGMGATAIVVHFDADRFSAVHIGDSRMYRFSEGRLEQLTVDHTLAQQYLDQGLVREERGGGWFGNNVLLKALGIDENIDPDITEGRVKHEDLFLLCSDGLNEAVADEEIIELLGGDQIDLIEKAERLIDAANRNGGPDNVSVILVRQSSNKIH